MIVRLVGSIVGITERALVLDVRGLGYEVFVTRELAAGCKVGSELTLHTHFNVREDAQELYGFLSQAELEFFKLLLTVSGIGPKSALNILDVVRPDDIRRAVTTQDSGSLHTVHGLGKKTAEKLVIELKDKLEAIGPSSGAYTADDQSVLEAIVNLGYSGQEAREALKAVRGKATTLEDKVRLALKTLSRR